MDKYEDLRAFLEAARRFGDCGLTVEEIMRAFKPTPRPFEETNPNLSILRRFAKVAGWDVQERTYQMFPVIINGPGFTVASDEAAAKWLDSPEALDAAAIVAVRKGGGLRYWPNMKTGNLALSSWHAIVARTSATPFGVSENVRVADSASAPRAAVLACLAAFEEKP